jgi:hypothetical protein
MVFSYVVSNLRSLRMPWRFRRVTTHRGRPAVVATAFLKRVMAAWKSARSFGKTSRPFWNTWYFGMVISSIHVV